MKNFTVNKTTTSTKCLRTLVHLTGLRDENDVKEEIAIKLGRELIKHNLINFYQDDSFQKKIVGEINVVEPGIRYANIFEGVFKVDGVAISNDDLVFAVRETFPERLI